jgi:AcrR family transcriptional regulator
MTPEAAARSRRKPVQSRSLATVEAIIEAAAQVFARCGYAAGTTNRIAERAGVSIGTLYQYFPNKDAILIALVEHHVQEGERLLRSLLRELVERPPPLAEMLERTLSALLELHRHEPRLHRVLFEEAPRPAELRARLDLTFELASEAVARYLSLRPEVNVSDPQLAAQLLVQSAEAITHGLVIHPRAGIAPEAYAREAAAMLERYLLG